MTTFLITIQRAAFRRFREGRPGPWGAIAASVFGMRILMRWTQRRDRILYREVIEPGETITVAHLTETVGGQPKPSRRARRRAARAEHVVVDG